MAAMSNGHNSGELTPGQAKALFMFHYQEIADATDAANAANEIRKTKRKEAKAHGIVLADIDFGLRVAKVEDTNIIVQELIRHQEIATFFGLPAGTQTDFDFDREPLIDRLKREGYAAGYANQERDPPVEVDSRQGQAWLKEYDKGRAQQLSDLAEAMETIERNEKAAVADGQPDDGADNPEGEDEDEEAGAAA
jgi:hypothetical protein